MPVSYKADGRRISINSTDILVVQEDTGTASIVFSIPLSESSTDLTTLAPFVIFRPDGVTGARFQALENMQVVGNRVEVTWKINRNTSFQKGTLKFQIVFTDSSSDPVATPGTKRWSTEICQVNVPESLVGESYPVPTEPIIAQMTEIAAQIVQPASSMNARLTTAESDITTFESIVTIASDTLTAYQAIGYSD